MGRRIVVRWQGLLFLPAISGEDNREMGFWVVKRLDYKTESLCAKLMFIWPIIIYTNFPPQTLSCVFEGTVMSRKVILRRYINKQCSLRQPCYVQPLEVWMHRKRNSLLCEEQYLKKSCPQHQSACLCCSAFLTHPVMWYLEWSIFLFRMKKKLIY